MNIKTILILLTLILLIILGGKRYTHHFNHACCPESNSMATPSAINGKWSDHVVAQNKALFKEYKDSVLYDFDESTSMLRITGLYYPDETNSTTYTNLGVARAVSARNNFFDKDFRKNITIASRMINDAPAKTDKFKACELKVVPTSDVKARVERKGDKIIFYFPFNSNNPNLNPNIALFVSELAEEMKSSTDKIKLTGHTDNVGEEAVNMDLSVQRANVIKGLLEKNGITSERIAVEGKGELEPQTDNDTDAGRSLNRRVELIQIK